MSDLSSSSEDSVTSRTTRPAEACSGPVRSRSRWMLVDQLPRGEVDREEAVGRQGGQHLVDVALHHLEDQPPDRDDLARSAPRTP